MARPVPPRSRRRRPPRVRVLLALGLLVVGLAACEKPDADNDSRSATQGMPDLQQDLEAQKWRLDWSDSSVDPRAPTAVTLRFDGDTVSGRGPCNTYHGTYTTDLDSWTVTISDLATTKRACTDRRMRAEHAYLDALTRVRDVQFSHGYFHVVLDNGAGDRLSYEAYDTYR